MDASVLLLHSLRCFRFDGLAFVVYENFVEIFVEIFIWELVKNNVDRFLNSNLELTKVVRREPQNFESPFGVFEKILFAINTKN